MISNVDDHMALGDEPTPTGNNLIFLTGLTGGATPPQEAASGSEQAVSSQGAANLINMAEQFMLLTRIDVDFAEDGMNSDRISKWAADAENMLEQAKQAFAAEHYTQAASFVAAARMLAGTARMLIAQTLGINNLPSYNHDSRNPLYTPEWWLSRQSHALPQQEVRSELTMIHSDIMRRDPLPAFEGCDGPATYLAEALNAYKAAHSAYIDGNYLAASDAGWLAQALLRVADLMVQTVAPDLSPTMPARLHITTL